MQMYEHSVQEKQFAWLTDHVCKWQSNPYFLQKKLKNVKMKMTKPQAVTEKQEETKQRFNQRICATLHQMLAVMNSVVGCLCFQIYPDLCGCKNELLMRKSE